LDVVTGYFNLEVNDDDIYMTLPESWPGGLNTPTIIVPLQKAHYGVKQAPRISHNDIISFSLSLEFTQFQAEPTLYLRRDGILMLL
jgi:hypothetical protein